MNFMVWPYYQAQFAARWPWALLRLIEKEVYTRVSIFSIPNPGYQDDRNPVCKQSNDFWAGYNNLFSTTDDGQAK